MVKNNHVQLPSPLGDQSIYVKKLLTPRVASRKTEAHMRTLVLALAAGTALAFGSGAANASNIITGINSTVLNSTGTSGPFGAVVNDSPFTDAFAFTLNLPSNTNAQISTISMNG